MKEEDKELLLKDLCARLPYGVKVQDEIGRINKLVIGNADLVRLYYNDFSIYSEKQLSLPCLFPLSSMTEEQEEEFNDLFYRYHESAFIFNEKFSYDRCSIKDIGFYPCYLQDWLNKNHFDYRGLIKKGLAIDATNLNIY